ncbi:hypothetical protein A3B18_00195 [Candidatus Giovannonibacteria bacterium RIFCSPLOWO2_01_FULL_46_13]|uniref:Uncharacterized protein n=1 Tax=Candidatus Giovannonibacteria bacterium RIFCSPLOWO2_01_FULL_46_13 TaxID=1798352 RepID=A0A1F5X3A6_9BACT|nr:MAG: hypothetical protein A3B18_00195 [Candidatus Giovannonibacteria bacterium RIFCSPLOWO2_01_FULL_46_13]
MALKNPRDGIVRGLEMGDQISYARGKKRGEWILSILAPSGLARRTKMQWRSSNNKLGIRLFMKRGDLKSHAQSLCDIAGLEYVKVSAVSEGKRRVILEIE